MLNDTQSPSVSWSISVPDLWQSNQIVLAGVVGVFGLLIAAAWNNKSLSGDLPVLHGPPIIGHFRFFSERYAFVNDGLRKLGSAFQFKILNYRVIAVSGEQSRKDFLTSSALNFRAGYTTLHGSAPNVEDVGLDAEHHNGDDSVWFSKHLIAVLRKDRLEKLLPKLFEDIERMMEGWGSSGKFDPLDEIYRIVFQLTVRAGACREIAENEAEFDRMRKLFMLCERTTSAKTVLMKWWPSESRKAKLNATKELANMFQTVITNRRTSGRKEEDALQVLLDEGCTDNDILQFILTTLFAGQTNSGIMSGWMLMFLHTNPEWKARVVQEIQTFITKYAPDTSDSDRPESLGTRLSHIPPNVWENEMPAIDLCLRETIRIVQTSVLIRRNTGDDLLIGGHKVKHGDFIIYPTSDAHHNAEIYPEPLKFDPSRYERLEDKKQNIAFVGWGAGRHPCIGMRFAKLEIKCITAMFLSGFDYDVVDEKDQVLYKLPEPARNNTFIRTKRPDDKPLYIRYRRNAI